MNEFKPTNERDKATTFNSLHYYSILLSNGKPEFGFSNSNPANERKKERKTEGERERERERERETGLRRFPSTPTDYNLTVNKNLRGTFGPKLLERGFVCIDNKKAAMTEVGLENN